MNQQTIATSMTPEIYIGDVGGDLQVKGWDRSEVNIKANADDLTLQHEEDTLHISCTGSIALRVPEGASLNIGSVHGETRIKLLDEGLQIGTLYGSLVVRGAAGLKTGVIHGGLLAKNIGGDLLLEQVHGSATIRSVQGDCQILRVMGDVNLRHCEGDLRIQADGGMRVRLGELNGDVTLKTNGALLCHLPEDASASIEAAAPEIRVVWQDEKHVTSDGSFSTTVGGGQHTVSLTAEGSLILHSWEGGQDEEDEAEHAFEDFGHGFEQSFNQEIARQVEAQVEAMTRQLNDNIASLTAQIGRSGLPPEKTEEIIRKARESSERATTRAQERMRKAQERLEQKMENARRRSELRQQAKEKRHQTHGRTHWTPTWPQPPQPPEPPREPVSDDERLMILRMLEQKKITIEEAEQLLSALEGE
jgi:hypothetical protein